MYLIRSKLLRANSVRTLSAQLERLFLTSSNQQAHHNQLIKSLSNSYCTQSTTSQPDKKINTKNVVNPFKLVESDLKNLYADIRKELWTDKKELSEIASYYFDAQGKAFR